MILSSESSFPDPEIPLDPNFLVGVEEDPPTFDDDAAPAVDPDPPPSAAVVLLVLVVALGDRRIYS